MAKNNFKFFLFLLVLPAFTALAEEARKPAATEHQHGAPVPTAQTAPQAGEDDEMTDDEMGSEDFSEEGEDLGAMDEDMPEGMDADDAAGEDDAPTAPTAAAPAKK